jgi:hypothetical protein
MVSSNAFPRLATKLFGSSCSWATWMPVISAAIPPDALHRARAIAITSVKDTPARFAFAMDVSWNERNSWTSSGSAEAMSSTCLATSSGSATRP